jgi:hypothetical protein
MATIEGNEIALRKVASELIPPVRSGQDARTDQDSFGAPFTTVEYRVFNEYAIYDPPTGQTFPQQSLAPAWAYGLMLEESNFGSDFSAPTQTLGAIPVRYFAAFGSAQKTNEVELTPGKVLRFPRGARRVFIRSNQTLAQGLKTIRVTWILDRFATIATGGSAGPMVVQSWQGDGSLGQLNPATQNDLSLSISPYTFFSLYIQNATNAAYSYDTNVLGDTIDTGNIPAGASRLISYGPGVNNLTGVMQGHGFVIPIQGMMIDVNRSVPNPVGSIIYSWRGY